MDNKEKIQARKKAAYAIRIICEAAQRLTRATKIILKEDNNKEKTDKR